MKQSMLLLMLLAGICLQAMAQSQNDERLRMTPEQRANLRTMRMERDLQLTTEQKEKIQQANLKAELTFQENLSSSDKELQKTKFEEINNQRDASYKQTLTESQYGIYAQNRDRSSNAKQHSMPAQKDNPQQPRRPRAGQHQAGHPEERKAR